MDTTPLEDSPPKKLPKSPISQESPQWLPGTSLPPHTSTPGGDALGAPIPSSQAGRVIRPWPTFLPRLSTPFLPGFCFLLADMIMQSTEAISGFPVCL